MDTLIDIVKYLFVNYPNKNELSKARVVKMVYLADWKSALIQGRQLTTIQWFFNNYGPYVSEVVAEIRKNPDFQVSLVSNCYGEPKELISLRDNFSSPEVSETTRNILDFVIKQTSPLYWEDFISLVYSTYPIVSQPRYSYLDLVSLSHDYKGS